MAVLTPTSLSGPYSRDVIETTLGASDTFTYLPGTGQLLMLRNITGGALSPKLLGNAAVDLTIQTGGFVLYSTGFVFPAIAATTGVKIIALDTIPAYLAGGTVTVTLGSGVKATLFNPA